MKPISQIGYLPDRRQHLQRIDDLVARVYAAREALGVKAHLLTDFIIAICRSVGAVYDAPGLAEQGYDGFRQLRACLKAYRERLPVSDNPFHDVVVSFLRDKEHVLKEQRCNDICCISMAKEALRIAADHYMEASDILIAERLTDERLTALRLSLRSLLGEENTARLEASLFAALLPVSPMALYQQSMLFSLIDMLSDQDGGGDSALAFVLDEKLL